jgi:hypothetical protein
MPVLGSEGRARERATCGEERKREGFRGEIQAMFPLFKVSNREWATDEDINRLTDEGKEREMS